MIKQDQKNSLIARPPFYRSCKNEPKNWRGTFWSPCVRIAASYSFEDYILIVCNHPMVIENNGWQVICQQDFIEYDIIALRKIVSEPFPDEGWEIQIPGSLLQTGDHWMWI